MGTRRKKTDQEEEASLFENESSKRVKTEDDNSCRYEEAREQRIKENKERMHKLGLFDLSLNLKPQIKNPPQKKKKTTPEPKHSPQRRSSRYFIVFFLRTCFGLNGTSKGPNFLHGSVPISKKLLPLTFVSGTGNPFPFFKQIYINVSMFYSSILGILYVN